MAIDEREKGVDDEDGFVTHIVETTGKNLIKTLKCPILHSCSQFSAIEVMVNFGWKMRKDT